MRITNLITIAILVAFFSATLLLLDYKETNVVDNDNMMICNTVGSKYYDISKDKVVLYINSDFYEYNKSECTIYEP